MTTITALQGLRPVGENTVRENVGVGLDELTVGLVIEHRPGRTVTATDHTLMLALTGNPAPVHSDTQFCAATGREKVLVCGIVTLGLVIGMTVRATSGLTSANLALDDVRFEHPVHEGDTLYATTEVLEARPSTSRPHEGVVTCRANGYNQDSQRVLTFTRTFLVPADAATVRSATNY
ncbi:MaoC family dehydratase [Streptomyces sp. CBMA156]|uniref:MaoC family dehydratase n=1 Tax=Streptomyces sp. CBMA156 TaxID=1930280 RepID=UPI00166213F6|nr:MaoC family dehydratase [Streptomyces sp. CBMA156]MBD0672847.1 molybdenum cofactor biosynthesis protein MoeC [Streptomyces sp. CBMA156]MBD0675802.1 molybdenum cofactor biosynthesis protein MoeC [Streptomyces sp. CBMA156]